MGYFIDVVFYVSKKHKKIHNTNKKWKKKQNF